MKYPTSVRWPTETEWDIVKEVYKKTLPSRYRVCITNGLGAGGAAFTIPTSMIGEIAAGYIAGFGGLIGQYLSSVSNLGYLVNVGGAYRSLSANQNRKELLVHEVAHVWQGYNSVFANTYAIKSALHQCAGILDSDGNISGRGSAYNYTSGKEWKSYNPEQQASIIEDWYAAGKPESGELWPYIQDHVRKGDV